MDGNTAGNTPSGLKLTGERKDASAPASSRPRRDESCITLSRAGHRWSFRFTQDEIPAVRRRIQMMTIDDRIHLTTYDAAILLHRLDQIAADAARTSAHAA